MQKGRKTLHPVWTPLYPRALLLPQCYQHASDITWPHLRTIALAQLVCFGTFLAKVADTQEPPRGVLAENP